MRFTTVYLPPCHGGVFDPSPLTAPLPSELRYARCQHRTFRCGYRCMLALHLHCAIFLFHRQKDLSSCVCACEQCAHACVYFRLKLCLQPRACLDMCVDWGGLHWGDLEAKTAARSEAFAHTARLVGQTPPGAKTYAPVIKNRNFGSFGLAASCGPAGASVDRGRESMPATPTRIAHPSLINHCGVHGGRGKQGPQMGSARGAWCISCTHGAWNARRATVR